MMTKAQIAVLRGALEALHETGHLTRKELETMEREEVEGKEEPVLTYLTFYDQ